MPTSGSRDVSHREDPKPTLGRGLWLSCHGTFLVSMYPVWSNRCMEKQSVFNVCVFKVWVFNVCVLEVCVFEVRDFQICVQAYFVPLQSICQCVSLSYRMRWRQVTSRIISEMSYLPRIEFLEYMLYTKYHTTIVSTGCTRFRPYLLTSSKFPVQSSKGLHQITEHSIVLQCLNMHACWSVYSSK